MFGKVVSRIASRCTSAKRAGQTYRRRTSDVVLLVNSRTTDRGHVHVHDKHTYHSRMLSSLLMWHHECSTRLSTTVKPVICLVAAVWLTSQLTTSGHMSRCLIVAIFLPAGDFRRQWPATWMVSSRQEFGPRKVYEHCQAVGLSASMISLTGMEDGTKST